jgi:RHS repeat-associated protein
LPPGLEAASPGKQEASPGGTLQMQATYVYDALRNRVEKDVWTTGAGLVVTRFAYDGQNVWADLNSSNQLQTRRLYLDGVDQVFARISSGGTAAWYLTDRQGSIRDISDNSGNVIDHLDYDGFGTVTNETQPTNGDRYKWTGREFDSETGLQYNRARYYAGGVGRWTTQDSLGSGSGDLNFYRYVLNAPLNETDPTGWFGYTLSMNKVFKGTGSYGAFAWGVNWDITPAACAKGGAIVQDYEIDWNVETLQGTYVARPQFFRGITTHWDEAWIVAPNASTSNQQGRGPFDPTATPLYQADGLVLPPGLDFANDWFAEMDVGRSRRTGLPNPQQFMNTTGEVTMKGSAAYYDCLTEDLLKKAGFRQLNPDTGAGLLYSIAQDDPGWIIAANLFAQIPEKYKSDFVSHSATAVWGSIGGRGSHLTYLKTTPPQ